MLTIAPRLVTKMFPAFSIVLLAACATLTASAQSLPAPTLIPYTSTLIAGNPAVTTGGFSGDGSKAAGTSLNGATTLAVDAEGNIYIADTGNAVIREVNAQTGIIKIIAGLPPTKCVQNVCTATSGYTDNVPANSAAIGTGTRGIAVDGFGNVFFDDYNQHVIRVIYRGGTHVANLIALEDPTAAPSAASVVPGNVYLVAGIYNTKGAVDKVLATAGSMHDPAELGLDAAGNIYVEDFGNNVIRVVNTQSTTQNFFGISVAPGFIAAVIDCGTLTTTCGSTFTGIAPGAADYGAALAAQAIAVDAYGNVYEVNTKGAAAIFAGVAYAGGAPLTKLLSQVIAPATPIVGDFYNVINGNPALSTVPGIPLVTPYPIAVLANQYNNIVLRASAIAVDPQGNVYYLDNHFPWIFRIDANSQVGTRITGSSARTGGTAAAPVACNFTAGAIYAPTIALGTDNYGDGCPSTAAVISGNGSMTFDAAGSLYLADSTENVVRKFSVNSQFPSTPVGTPVTQTLQVHFDQTNLPAATATATPSTTSPLSIQTGNPDYTIGTAPTCTSNTTSLQPPTQTTTGPLDGSIDCWVQVTFMPSQPGLRAASLQATASGGTVYNIPLTGIGQGPAIALDGGTQNAVAATGLGAVSGIAIDSIGNQYIADPTNNHVVEISANGTQTNVGSGFSGPRGVAVDVAGNVYVADTGNNRVVIINASSGAQAAIGTGFSAPQGVAVDQNLNVYVADTGNGRVVILPANPIQTQSTLFQFTSSTPIISKPVAIAVDSLGNVYVADPATKQIIEIPPGGGDLQNVIGSASQLRSVDPNIPNPSGLAVDAAGNVYISDATNNVVVEQPSSTGPGAYPFSLSFTGLKGPAGLALDPMGNLYVADSGNSRVLEMNRRLPTVNFGPLGVFQPALAAGLTLTNIGNQNQTLNAPVFLAAGNTADFTLADSGGLPCSGTVLYAGLTCGLSSSFLPVSAGAFTETVALQGGTGNGGITANLLGSGVAALASISTTLTNAPVSGGTTASATATVTQTHGVNTPTGTVTFVYTVNEGNTARGGSTTTLVVPLVAGSAGAATAVLNLTGLLPARRYSIVATYNGDPGDTGNTATPLTFTVPGGTMLTVVANPVTFAYGGTVPTITGTVSGILPADAGSVTYSFSSGASSTTGIGTYPITLVLTGGNYLNYVVPPAVTSTGAPAVVTETPAALTVKVNNASAVYGSQNISPTSVVTGAVNGDTFSIHYSPASSSVLDVGTYPLIPTLTGPAANYTIAITNGTLTITPTPTTIAMVANTSSLLVTPNNGTLLITTPATGVTANGAAVLPTNLSSEQVTITVASSTSGLPTGTVTLSDVFTPFSTGVAAAPATIGPLTLTKGVSTYVPTSTALGVHAYSVVFSGSLDYQGSSSAASTDVIVDNPDFYLTAPTSPLVILPGTLPGGNQTITGESAANPEQAVITLTPALNYTGTVTLSCSSPSSYVTCGFSNIASTTITSTAAIVINSTTAQTATLNVSTPATLPVNYSSYLAHPSLGNTALALLPLGMLALLPFARGSRKRLSRILWVFFFFVATSFGLSGCSATNLVKFYTPVPEGLQTLTITATDGTITQKFTMTISIQ